MRILIVEDDPLVRASVVDALSGEGHEIIEADTAERALQLCGTHAADLLFTDIRLGGPLNGWDVAERCRESDPDLPVIYATGYSDVAPRPVPGSVRFNWHGTQSCELYRGNRSDRWGGQVRGPPCPPRKTGFKRLEQDVRARAAIGLPVEPHAGCLN